MPRTEKFARVLAAIHNSGYLGDPECSGPILDFIRKATEPPSNWHATAHYRSRAASALLEGKVFSSRTKYQKFCSEQLSHEHVVPNRALLDILIEEKELNEHVILNCLRSFGIRATITRTENTILKDAGYQSLMPKGFWLREDPLFRDPFARYKAVTVNESSTLFDTLQPLVGQSWLNEASQKTHSK